jgi:outer membrane protein assembly factor BamB
MLLIVLSALLFASISCGQSSPTKLWEVEIYTNYPRNFGPGVVHVINGNPQLFVQGTRNCAEELTAVSFNPYNGTQQWIDKQLLFPDYCGFDEAPPVNVETQTYFYVQVPYEELPMLLAYSAVNGSYLWNLTLGTESSNTLTNIVTGGSLVFTVVHHVVFAVDASSGDLSWSKTMPNGSTCRNLRYFERSTGGLVLCSTDASIECFSASTGETVWEAATGDHLYFWATGAASYDSERDQFIFQYSPFGWPDLAYVAALDAGSGSLQWKVASQSAENPNELSISEGIVVTKEGMSTQALSTQLVARSTKDGTLLWNETSSFGNFRGSYLADEMVYVVVDMINVEGRSLHSGQVQWRWNSSWCERHHSTGVACGLAAPYVWGGILFINYGYGEHDHCPFLALQLPGPV